MILRVCSTPGACVDMNGSEQVSKTAVLTDSASDIPRELEEKYGIDILPFSIVVDGQSYIERVDFTNEQYYEMLTKAEGIPKTSQITMLRFLEKFCAYADEGYTDVIFVSINSAGSNTYNAACMAAESLRDERPGCTMNVHVVDSHTYSMTYGWHVCEAARKLQAGADVKSVVEYLEDQLARMEIMLSMYTLRFVKKSGRVSAAAAFAGELLGLRPIIHMVDDTTSTIAKVRGDSAVMPVHATVSTFGASSVPQLTSAGGTGATSAEPFQTCLLMASPFQTSSR